ncbi:conserved hypothetical protein [Culex quinquefasciatus]|uniref:Uncharacterized protein n=1 Tax=Culex quinquefasciatus TaxID=7176 RepID=B0W8W7_CULQU|nr:conserved hypothetical protein [Culex quinquefasciatus]|eukprot:XP_001845182.1 conserved hypothetical protein [Culex quinquefasciatus]
MASDEKFKKFLKSGTFSRWTQKYQTREAEFTTRETAGSVSSGQPVPEPAHVDVPGFEFEADQADVSGPEFLDQNEESDFDLEYWSPEEYSSDEDQEGQFYEDVQSEMEEEHAQPESLTTFMRNWSLEFNIPHQALQPLLQRLHQIDSSLPESPRRLLQTPRTKATIVEIEGGKYWHQGFGK